ncbi:unnamed protein product [Spirodela intermedia]|uniref:Uncharacterized protein n=1 Tax=Spirodela intermedia TaxID=51605 RepID=A0A7I8KUY3_SPIIN|nr:unnamed protein product [Spirodela intermedia]
MLNPDSHRMYGRSEATAPQPVSPRISFSNGFVLDSATGAPSVKYERSSAVSPSSSDFEFSAGSYNMMTADELFFKGRLLPLKDASVETQKGCTTLRDEVLSGERDAYPSLALSSSRMSTKLTHRWKSFLGLSRSHSWGKKNEKKQDKQQPRHQVEGIVKDLREVMHSPSQVLELLIFLNI